MAVRPGPIFVVAIAGTAILCPLQAASSADVAQVIEDVYATGDFQRELPLYPHVPPPEEKPTFTDRADRPIARDLPPGESEPRHNRLPAAAIGEGANVLLWVIIAVIGVLLGVYLVRRLPDWVRRREDGSEPVPDEEARKFGAGPGGARGPTVLDEADRLASAGACDAAIHGLLLAAYDYLRRLGQRLPAAFTSREFLSHVRLPDDQKAALRALVEAVEISHFGGRVAGPAEYRLCRAQFLQLSGGSTGRRQ